MAISMRAARVNAELTQVEAAKIIGVAPNTISRWEKGISSPTFKYIRPIVEAYGLTSYEDIIFVPTDNAKSVKENG